MGFSSEPVRAVRCILGRNARTKSAGIDILPEANSIKRRALACSSIG